MVLAAPSGTGKTTIAQALVAQRRDVGFSISATTRAPRSGEKDGRDYFFLTPEQFERGVRNGEFVECAVYAGHRYGTLRHEVDRIRRAGSHVLLDIDVQGAAQVRKAYPWPKSLAIFLLPPSGAELRRRLMSRGTESDDALAKRLQQARRELKSAPDFDVLIVNDNLEQAVADVSRTIDQQHKPERSAPMLDRVTALLADLKGNT